MIMRQGSGLEAMSPPLPSDRRAGCSHTSDTSGGSSVFIQRGVLETTFDLTAIQFRVAVGVGA